MVLIKLVVEDIFIMKTNKLPIVLFNREILYLPFRDNHYAQ